MLEQLTIEDFQAHRKLSIKLDPAITTIVGPSDSGKSAVIRALIWLATNRPSGDSFIREGTKQTRVHLDVDGHVVTRCRGGSENTYTLDDEELKAFGNDVPTEVARLLNISGINIQRQHDSPYWFSETAGEVSRQLNQIVDLTIIDRTLANLDKASRATAAEIRTLEQQEEQAKAQRSVLAWARKAQEHLGEVETLQEQWQAAAETHRDAAEMVQAVRLHQETAEAAGKQQEAAERAAQIGTQWEKVRGQTVLLRKLIQEVRDNSAQAHRTVPDLSPLIQLQQAAEEAVTRRQNLESKILTVTLAQKDVQTFQAEAARLEKEFHKEMGEVCPLCGKKL